MFLKQLFKKSYPRLDWIQVEVSSLCDGKCIYCPHTEYRANWQNRLIPIEMYEKLIPAFKKTKLVFLQGWGEPFTHPQFIELLRIARKAGCMVGTTTNGTMLNSEKISELIDEGLDMIGFSLAGVDKKNDSVRKRTQIQKVLKCVDEIHRIKDSKSVDNPKIHIAYMLLRSGLKDIHKLPVFLKNAGIDQTVISSLSLVVNKSLKKETLLVSGEQEYNELCNTFNEIKKEGASSGTDISFNIVSPVMEESFCSENIERALVIGADGSVSPCVMGLIPAVGENHYFFKENRIQLKNITFGNISDENLNTIWHKKGYKDFLRSHRFRDGFDLPSPSGYIGTRIRLHNLCESCNKRFIIDFR